MNDDPTSWTPRLGWLAFGLILGASVVLWLARDPDAPDGDAAPRTPQADAAAATAPDEAPDAVPPEAECYLGAVLAREAVDVAAEVEGHVAAIPVRVGDEVAHGDLLATLDTEMLHHRLKIEQAALSNTEAELRKSVVAAERAEQEYDRLRALEDLVSEQDLEAARFEHRRAATELEAATARAEEARARLDQLESQLEHSEIRSPFAGTVAQRYLDSGAMVTSGTRVVRLISSGALLVRFAVPPEEIATLAVGSRVRVEVEVLRRAFEAEVRQRAPEIDPPSQMIFVEAHLEAPEVAIPSGAVARVTRLVPGAPPAPRCLAP